MSVQLLLLYYLFTSLRKYLNKQKLQKKGKKLMAKYTSIGGQALIEGILMKSPEKTALVVRIPDGSIDVSYLDHKSLRQKYKVLNLLPFYNIK